MYKLSVILAPRSGDPFELMGENAGKKAQHLFQNLSGYVQTRSLDPANSAASGVVECYFKERSDAESAIDVNCDALLQAGTEALTRFVGMERVVMRSADFASQDKMKGVYPFRRRSDLSVAQFQDHWWHVHGPIAALTEEALGYVQVHALEALYRIGEPRFDGITEIYWPDVEAAARAVDSRQMKEDQANDAPNFVDMDSIILFFAKEEIIIRP